MDVVHEMPLLSTLALGLTAAFVCGMVASKLRLSPIVGYLLAGILIGPFTPGIEANTSIASELAEIGIVLLMFGVGLHFSIHDLLKVKNIALPGAVGQILITVAMGAGMGYILGWPLEKGLLVGLALSVASTVVLLRALEQHNILYSQNGRIAVGWLIVEDLAMILALVLIPALAPGLHKAASSTSIMEWLPSLSLALGKITLFILCMLVIGKRFLPWLLRLVAGTRSRELFTLAVIAVAIGIAFGAAEFFGVSFALGAFFAGMMIKESDLSQEAADKALPQTEIIQIDIRPVGGIQLIEPRQLAPYPQQMQRERAGGQMPLQHRIRHHPAQPPEPGRADFLVQSPVARQIQPLAGDCDTLRQHNFRPRRPGHHPQEDDSDMSALGRLTRGRLCVIQDLGHGVASRVLGAGA